MLFRSLSSSSPLPWPFHFSRDRVVALGMRDQPADQVQKPLRGVAIQGLRFSLGERAGLGGIEHDAETSQLMQSASVDGRGDGRIAVGPRARSTVHETRDGALARWKEPHGPKSQIWPE